MATKHGNSKIIRKIVDINCYIEKSFKSHCMRHCMIIFVIWTLCVLSYLRLNVINVDSKETENVSRAIGIQSEGIKALAEATEKTKGVTGRKAPLDIQVHVEYDTETELRAQASINMGKQDKAQGVFTERLSEDDRTRITLDFKNLSYRPITVNDVYVRQGENILGGRGYKNRIKLPIRVKASGNKVNFFLEENHRKNMTDILIRDTEGNEYICTIEPRKCVNK